MLCLNITTLLSYCETLYLRFLKLAAYQIAFAFLSLYYLGQFVTCDRIKIKDSKYPHCTNLKPVAKFNSLRKRFCYSVEVFKSLSRVSLIGYSLYFAALISYLLKERLWQFLGTFKHTTLNVKDNVKKVIAVLQYIRSSQYFWYKWFKCVYKISKARTQSKSYWTLLSSSIKKICIITFFLEKKYLNNNLLLIIFETVCNKKLWESINARFTRQILSCWNHFRSLRITTNKCTIIKLTFILVLLKYWYIDNYFYTYIKTRHKWFQWIQKNIFSYFF